MSPLIKKHMPAIYDVITEAQKTILEKTGLTVVLTVRMNRGLIEDDLNNLYEAMCRCWGVDLDFVKDSSRQEDRPIMRKLLWMAGKRLHQKASLTTLGSITNVEDHSTVLQGINQGYAWLEVQDKKFCSYYEPVKQYFNV